MPENLEQKYINFFALTMETGAYLHKYSKYIQKKG